MINHAILQSSQAFHAKYPARVIHYAQYIMLLIYQLNNLAAIRIIIAIHRCLQARLPRLHLHHKGGLTQLT